MCEPSRTKTWIITHGSEIEERKDTASGTHIKASREWLMVCGLLNEVIFCVPAKSVIKVVRLGDASASPKGRK
jgi:hypothetical protein